MTVHCTSRKNYERKHRFKWPSLILNYLQRNSLYRAPRFANLEGILGFSVPLIILVKAGLIQITM